MLLLSASSLLSPPLIPTKNRVRVFPTGRPGHLKLTTAHGFHSSRLSRRAPSPMATPSSHENGGIPGLGAQKSPVFRIGEIKRIMKENSVYVYLNLDGSGVAECSTGIPFLDNMLDQLASVGSFDLRVRAIGGIHIDDHHTNKDVALTIGMALRQALEDMEGICRCGQFVALRQEAIVEVALDLSGGSHLSCDLTIPTERVETYDTQLVEHFFQSLVNTSGMTLHIRQIAGENPLRIIESTFIAFAIALRRAVEYSFR